MFFGGVLAGWRVFQASITANYCGDSIPSFRTKGQTVKVRNWRSEAGQVELLLAGVNDRPFWVERREPVLVFNARSKAGSDVERLDRWLRWSTPLSAEQVKPAAPVAVLKTPANLKTQKTPANRRHNQAPSQPAFELCAA